MCSDGATKDHESLDDLEQAQLAATLSASSPQQRKKQKKNQSRRKRLVDSLATKRLADLVLWSRLSTEPRGSVDKVCPYIVFFL